MYASQVWTWLVFLPSSVGKESACNAGDPRWIPGSGRSSGEGIGYPLQYSWASLVAQLVKNPSAIRKTWVWSLGWEDPLKKGKATHSSILAWRIPWTVTWGHMGSQRVRYDWVTFTFTGHGGNPEGWDLCSGSHWLKSRWQPGYIFGDSKRNSASKVRIVGGRIQIL